VFTSASKNGTDPEWNEDFEFEFICPQRPLSSYELEVRVDDVGMISTKRMGAVYLKLEDIISGAKKGTQTYQLGSKQGGSKGHGSVTIDIKWCRHGDRRCAGHAQKKTQVDCEMGCGKPLLQNLEKVVEQTRQSIKAARRGGVVDNEWKDDTCRGAGCATNLAALNRKYEDTPWAKAREQIAALKTELSKEAVQTCGQRIEKAIGQASTLKRTPAKKFSYNEARRAEDMLKPVMSKIKWITGCIEQKWWQLELLPYTGQVKRACVNHFQQ